MILLAATLLFAEVIPPGEPAGFEKQDPMERQIEEARYKNSGEVETEAQVQYYQKVAPTNPESGRDYFQHSHPIEPNPIPGTPLEEAPLDENPIPENPI